MLATISGNFLSDASAQLPRVTHVFPKIGTSFYMVLLETIHLVQDEKCFFMFGLFESNAQLVNDTHVECTAINSSSGIMDLTLHPCIYSRQDSDEGTSFTCVKSMSIALAFVSLIDRRDANLIVHRCNFVNASTRCYF